MIKVIQSKWLEPLTTAFNLLPKHIQKYCQSDVVIGGNPNWVHGFGNYEDLAHVAYEHHCFQKRTCLLLPNNYKAYYGDDYELLTCLHELGHVFHSQYLNFKNLELHPCRDYCKNSHTECFADAFANYFLPTSSNGSIYFEDLTPETYNKLSVILSK